MENIKAIIVDDEREGIDTLDFMLREYCPQVTVIDKFQSSVEALKKIKKSKPDLLFLDIQMPHINGLELLELLGTDSYNVIYTTAYDEFVLQALRLSAIDYLKKPIDEGELIRAVERVKRTGNVVQEQIKKTLSQFKKEDKVDLDTPFGIKVGNAIKFVKISDICYCQSDGNFTQVYLANGKSIYSSNPLKAMVERLPESYFFRTHREYLINLHHIKEYNKSEGGFVKMTCTNKSIPIARSRGIEFGGILSRL